MYNFLASNSLLGQVVVLPTNICPDVVDTLKYAQMHLRFVDISLDTLCMNEQIVLDAAKDVQIVLMVHTYGVEMYFTEFYGKLKEQNPEIIIIDDRCLCFPELCIEDSLADLVLYSLGSKKQVEMGKGAIGFMADKWKYDEVVVPDGNGVLENRCYTLNEQALLTKMDSIIAHKEKLNTIYRANLPKSIQFPERFQHWRFNIWVENKEQVLQALFNNGLFTSGHYKPQTQDCPIAQKLYDHVINLFNDQYYTEQQALKTCQIINQVIML